MSETIQANHPVQRQLDAYNARDIDAFAACWAEDCAYYEFPDRLLARGRDAVRARHLVRFQEPNLFGALLARTEVGSLVMDHELVRRTFPDGPGEVDVLAFYEVESGRIAKAWFKMGPPRLDTAAPPAIQPATPPDAPLIRALTRRAYTKWVAVIGREPLPMQADYEAAVRNHRIDLLHAGGALAGLIELVPGTAHLLVKNVAISPEFQGRGFGRLLLAHADRVAAGLDVPEARLIAHIRFEANIRLYKSVGYVIEREETFMGGTVVHMTKRY